MRAFGVRRDRAEVLGIAAIVLDAIGSRLGASAFIVPGVGIREGIVRELVEARKSRAADEDAHPLLSGARALARRFEADPGHGEQVKRLAGAIFSQLRDVHGMGARNGSSSRRGHLPRRRSLRERRATPCARRVPREELRHAGNRPLEARHARVPRAVSQQQDEAPGLHAEYTELSPGRRRQVRMLAAILRIPRRARQGSQGGGPRLARPCGGRRKRSRVPDLRVERIRPDPGGVPAGRRSSSRNILRPPRAIPEGRRETAAQGREGSPPSSNSNSVMNTVYN